MHTLVLDIGNTTVKAGCFTGAVLCETAGTLTADEVEALAARWQPQHVLIASVAEEAARWIWTKAVAVNPGEYCATFEEREILYASGEYKVTIGLSNNERTIHYSDDIVVLRISEIGELTQDRSYLRTKGSGVILNKGNIVLSAI